MSVDLRVYDNEHGDPVVVMVTTGTFDVSRLAGLLKSGRCEDQALADALVAGCRRHNGGRAALKLLAAHGGPDLLERVSGADTGKPWAVVLSTGQVNTYATEADARDVVDLVRGTDSPECELRHFEDGQWVVVDPMGEAR